MRVLFLLRHFLPEKSGMATQMFNLVHFMRGKNDVTVVRLPYKSEGAKHKYVSEIVPGRLFMEKEFMRLREKYKPDVVHFDSTWPMGWAVTRVFRDELKVLSVGGRTFDEFSEYWKYTKSNRLVGAVKGRFLSWIARRVMNSCDLIIAEGSDIEEHLRANGVESPIESINNGVDISRFKYKPSRGKKALFFGRYSWENGPDRFITIMKDTGFKAAMVGYGPQEEALKKLGGNVRGPVEWEEIPGLISSFDIVVLPFRRIGGISQTVTESMAAGRVVLTTRVGDLDKVIEDGKTGFFFSSEAQAREILKSLKPGKRKRVEKAARAKIKKDFSWESVAEKYVEAYKAHT